MNLSSFTLNILFFIAKKNKCIFIFFTSNRKEFLIFKNMSWVTHHLHFALLRAGPSGVRFTPQPALLVFICVYIHIKVYVYTDILTFLFIANIHEVKLYFSFLSANMREGSLSLKTIQTPFYNNPV